MSKVASITLGDSFFFHSFSQLIIESKVVNMKSGTLKVQEFYGTKDSKKKHLKFRRKWLVRSSKGSISNSSRCEVVPGVTHRCECGGITGVCGSAEG